MLTTPPKGVDGPAIDVKTIKRIYYGNTSLQFAVGATSCRWEWPHSDTDMEEEFRRVCNEVNSLLAKPTIQL